MQDCPVFTLTTNSANCKLESPLPPAIANEDVKGPLKGGLPNGLQIQYGPGQASKPGPAQPGPASQASPPPAQPDPAVPVVKDAGMPEVNQKNQVCEPADQPQNAPPKTTVPVTSSVDKSAAAITPAPAQSPPELQPGERVVGTVYSTQGDTVYQIVKIVKDEEKIVLQRKRDIQRQQHMRRHLRHQHHGHKHPQE